MLIITWEISSYHRKVFSFQTLDIRAASCQVSQDARRLVAVMKIKQGDPRCHINQVVTPPWTSCKMNSAFSSRKGSSFEWVFFLTPKEKKPSKSRDFGYPLKTPKKKPGKVTLFPASRDRKIGDMGINWKLFSCKKEEMNHGIRKKFRVQLSTWRNFRLALHSESTYNIEQQCKTASP